MNALSYITSNILAVLVLIILLWAANRKTTKDLPDQRIFILMLVVNILMLIFDCGSRIFELKRFNNSVFLVYLTNSVCYILNPLVSILYARYCEIKLHVPSKTIKINSVVYTVMFIIHAILSLVSLKTPMLFGIKDGKYIRGPFFILSFMLCYLPALFAFCEILEKFAANKKINASNRTEKVLLLYLVPPVVGAMIQFSMSDSMIIWISTMLSLLIIFINLQNAQITTDPLTGLNNRGRLHTFLEWKTNHIKDGNNLYLLMLDINDFKSVNDKYGHQIGDEALKAAVSCLQKGVRGNDFIARYGGDEFVVLSERANDMEIKDLIQNIHATTESFNEQKSKPFSLGFSIGCSVWNKNESTDEFIRKADNDMYSHKSSPK